MKRPLTRNERIHRAGFILIVFFDLLFGTLVTLALVDDFLPHAYLVEPTIGFAKPNTTLGKYDVASFATITTNNNYGDVFVQGIKIQVNVTAFVNNNDYNATGNSLYFAFLKADIWTTTNGKTGCEISLGPPRQIPLQAVPGTKGYEWTGEADICFLYQGDFAPVFVVDNGVNTTYVQEGVGENFVLPVVPPSQAVNYQFNLVILFLTGALIFYAIIESLSFLREIYSTAFPHRVEYEPNYGYPDTT